LSVEETLAKSAGSDYVERQVLCFKLNLALSQLNFYRGFHILLLHEYALGAGYPNLKGTCLGVAKFSGCLLSGLLIYVAHSISETEIVTLHIG
jgi:hypothetical protein